MCIRDSYKGAKTACGARKGGTSNECKARKRTHGKDLPRENNLTFRRDLLLADPHRGARDLPLPCRSQIRRGGERGGVRVDRSIVQEAHSYTLTPALIGGPQRRRGNICLLYTSD